MFVDIDLHHVCRCRHAGDVEESVAGAFRRKRRTARCIDAGSHGAPEKAVSTLGRSGRLSEQLATFHEGPGARVPFGVSRRDIGGLSGGSGGTFGVVEKEKGGDDGWLVVKRGVCAFVQVTERPESNFWLCQTMSPEKCHGLMEGELRVGPHLWRSKLAKGGCQHQLHRRGRSKTAVCVGGRF